MPPCVAIMAKLPNVKIDKDGNHPSSVNSFIAKNPNLILSRYKNQIKTVCNKNNDFFLI